MWRKKKKVLNLTRNGCEVRLGELVGWEGKQAGRQVSNHTGYEAHSAVLDLKILFSPAKPRVGLS
jgi:hypothetical protein